jgi:CheY-like chemotaxis protein
MPEAAEVIERLRVLVVDDNVHMIKIVKTILRGFGIKEFKEARDAADAFKHLRESRIDLVIVDYQMELLDGVEFVRLVRSGQDIPDPFLPVIMLSAHSERSRIISARDAGVTEFCAKPVSPADLWAKVASCLNRPRQFVRSGGYQGPDRRRRTNDLAAGQSRRASDRAAS